MPANPTRNARQQHASLRIQSGLIDTDARLFELFLENRDLILRVRDPRVRFLGRRSCLIFSRGGLLFIQ